MLEGFERFTHNDLEEMMETFMLAPQETTFLKGPCKEGSIRLSLDMEGSYGDLQHIPKTNYLPLPVMTRISHCGDATSLFGHLK